MSGFSRAYQILLVEESVPTARLLTTVLNQCGMRSVNVASTMEEACEILEHSRIDAVLCDWTGKGAIGFDILKAIRDPKGSYNSRLPVIMMASDPSLVKVTQARDAGATEFVAKPVSVKSLTRALWSALEKGRPFVESDHYFGPDRRRKRVEVNKPRRESDQTQDS